MIVIEYAEPASPLTLQVDVHFSAGLSGSGLEATAGPLGSINAPHEGLKSGTGCTPAPIGAVS